jgi:hypothetical protein
MTEREQAQDPFHEQFNRCPQCGKRMQFGIIGPPGGLRWFDRPQMFWAGLRSSKGERLVKGALTRNVHAARCRHCGLVVFQGDAG